VKLGYTIIFFALTACVLNAQNAAFDTVTYSKLLDKYVDTQGRVDYVRLKANDTATVHALYASLQVTGPDLTRSMYPNRNAALAYYLSAYNLLIWKNVIDRMPNFKGVDQNNFIFFKDPRYKVNGQEVNLDELEKKIIRGRFKDGRVHFALNCASGSCPILPRTVFTSERVQAQLETETSRFINEPRNVRFDATTNTVSLSKIFEWYVADFVRPNTSIIDYINKYRREKIPVGAKIIYVEYDWRLNDRLLPNR